MEEEEEEESRGEGASDMAKQGHCSMPQACVVATCIDAEKKPSSSRNPGTRQCHAEAKGPAGQRWGNSREPSAGCIGDDVTSRPNKSHAPWDMPALKAQGVGGNAGQAMAMRQVTPPPEQPASDKCDVDAADIRLDDGKSEGQSHLERLLQAMVREKNTVSKGARRRMSLARLVLVESRDMKRWAPEKKGQGGGSENQVEGGREGGREGG